MSRPNALTRRQVLKTTLAGSVAIGSAGLSGSARAQSGPPNIVFIMADDLGYADVSCYGQRDFETPNIDRIALEGLKLTQGYANSSVCSATRIGLITGRYQYRLRAGLEEPISGSARGNPDIGLPPQHPNLASILKKAGYHTALVGKWHMGFLPHFSPIKSGYDEFYGIMSGGVDYFSHKSNPADQKGELYEQETSVENHGYLTNLLGARAVKVINDRARNGKPFLLSLHFTAPHWPWEGPHDEAESRRIRRLVHYDGGTQKTYREMVRSLDLNIGRALEALDSNGLADNTIVIFTSDNGGERFSDVWPFTGTKAELLEGGLRVPMLVRWPRRIAANSTSEQAMMSMDWMPTLLAAGGATPDSAYPPDGENLLAVLTGQARTHPRKLYWRYKAFGQRALRDGDMKYLRINGNEFLFNVVNDPRERANLKARDKDTFERLKGDYEAWNRTMLPEIPESNTHAIPSQVRADRYSNPNPNKD